jgi:hypothetical protein
MKNYKVTVVYRGYEVFALTAKNEEEAELKALQFFSNKEPSNVKSSKCLRDMPTSVKVEVTSEVVSLPEADTKQE